MRHLSYYLYIQTILVNCITSVPEFNAIIQYAIISTILLLNGGLVFCISMQLSSILLIIIICIDNWQDEK